jgi:hypothetical protein
VRSNRAHPDSKNAENELLPTLDEFYDNDMLKASRNPRSRCVLCSIRTSCKTYRDLVNDFHHPSSHDFETKVSYWEYNTSEHNMFMAKSVKLKYLLRVDPINQKFHYVELHWDPSAQNLNYSILYAGLINITKVCMIDDGSLGTSRYFNSKFQNQIPFLAIITILHASKFNHILFSVPPGWLGQDFISKKCFDALQT